MGRRTRTWHRVASFRRRPASKKPEPTRLVPWLDVVERPCDAFQMTQLRALALFGFALSGCATTSGREWLNSPIDERAPPNAPEIAAVEAPPDARPRLSHTVTLGESYAVASPRSSAPATSGAPVQVNVQTHVPVVVNNYGGGYGYGYSGYGYGYGTRASAPVSAIRASQSASQKVGADFPAVPDYGPPAMR